MLSAVSDTMLDRPPLLFSPLLLLRDLFYCYCRHSRTTFKKSAGERLPRRGIIRGARAGRAPYTTHYLTPVKSDIKAIRRTGAGAKNGRSVSHLFSSRLVLFSFFIWTRAFNFIACCPSLSPPPHRVSLLYGLRSANKVGLEDAGLR